VESQGVLPLFVVHDTITVAVSEPANLYLSEELARLSGKKVQLVAALERDIRATLQAYLPNANVFVIDEIYEDVDIREFDSAKQDAFDIADIEEMSGQSPVVKLVNYILYQAIHDRASDIHIEPEELRCRVRYRVDGRLNVKLNPPRQMHPAVVSRVKIMAGMDISERRVPQDGDIHVAIDGRPFDLRVSTMPAKHGEKVVIRLIDNRNAVLPVEKMGMGPEIATAWREAIHSAHGMVLVTGPTGSGKSTTLYSALGEINNDEINISTVENPVEAQLQGVNQFQVNTKAGFTFAGALRSLLRQDPDVIMVGEIRDLETATIATQAAMTGHLVLSTLHTNDAISAVTRLINMGMEPFLVSAMLRGVLAQRLCRKVCPHCREQIEPEPHHARTIGAVLGEEPVNVHRGAGCSRCKGTGYAGRLGIFEMLSPDEQFLEAVASGATLQALRAAATACGHRTIQHDGFEKAIAGLTTVEEVVRVSTL
ncbi:MAG: GspE/PulE family protein, partial [Planctomycetota bacterium]